MSVHTPGLLATIVLDGIEVPAAHENIPSEGMHSHAEMVLRNDRSPFSGVQD